MTGPLIAAIIFAVRAWLGLSPWSHVVYCLIAEVLLLWALRPNIRRLLDGTEHGIGSRARKVETGPEKDKESE
jgi:glycerol-3-phosphate acyltransferase PlsY